jgi:cell division protein FtsN
VLQAGVFRNAEDAQRIRQQLAVLGVTASVQRIAVDNDVRHRVRIGPLDNLEEVNAVRRKLQGADIESIVIRVAD